MPKPIIHVFIGAGPANLHRALALRHVDKEAKFVFIDNRLQPANAAERIKRQTARANIFRFETDEVTERLLEEGVRPEDMMPLAFERQFVPVDRAPVFQMGDDRVFSPKDFTQIQIRDLQLLLFKSIEQNSRDNRPVFIADYVEEPKKDTDPSITQRVREIVRDNAKQLGIVAEDAESQTIHIHIATGALHGDEAKDEIVYADQMDIPRTTPEQHATADVARMTVTPIHGTVTFKIDPYFLETLKTNQVSLDNTDWQISLKEFGWNLIRPPRIRVFYSNDILYIGAEIPHSMNSIKAKAEYEKQVTDYTRQIAELVFPALQKQIHELPVNEHLRSRFPTARGQRGQVLKIERTDPESGAALQDNVTTFYHGDSRYLPHYQTGSGFITAFLENELYVNIYKQKNIHDLLAWLYKQPDTAGVKARFTKSEIITEYSQDLPQETAPAEREEYALEAFKAEVFKQRSLDIIEKNQEKVGRYLNALNTQTLQILSENIKNLVTSFNNNHPQNQLQLEDIKQVAPKHLAIALLQLGNTSFLKEQMPTLLNIDFTQIDDKKLLHLRDMLVKDLKFSLMVDRFASITGCKPYQLCKNYENLGDKDDMKPIEYSIKAIDLSIKQKEIEIVRAALHDYSKNSLSWRTIKSFLPWTRTHANVVKAREIIKKIDREEYASFNDLKQEIISLDTGNSIGHKAFKAVIAGIRKDIEPNPDHLKDHAKPVKKM